MQAGKEIFMNKITDDELYEIANSIERDINQIQILLDINALGLNAISANLEISKVPTTFLKQLDILEFTHANIKKTQVHVQRELNEIYKHLETD